MLRSTTRVLLLAVLFALLVSACRSPEDARQEARDKRDAFQGQLDEDG